jgi:hypothetical protein
MNVDLLRDNIMDQLTPMDAVNIVTGTGIKFSTEDMDKYTSFFKYIVRNRRWLAQRMQDG